MDGSNSTWESGVVGRDEASVATFLRTQPNLCKESIGSYISQDKAFNREVFENYLGTFDFHDMHLDEAVLSFFLSFKSTGCAQAGDRMMQKVTAAFITANPYSYDSAEAVYMLSFAVLMLHTDAHSEIIESKMSKTDFIQMNHGVNDGEDFPEEMLGAMYDRVVATQHPAPNAHHHLDDGADYFVATFQQSAEKGLALLFESGVVERDPHSVASYFSTHPELCREQLGEYFSDPAEFNQKVFAKFVESFALPGLLLDEAVLPFWESFHCSQEVGETLLTKFASAYTEANPGSFSNVSDVPTLCSIIIMLHTDAHSRYIENKMPLRVFLELNQGLFASCSDDMLRGIYERVTTREVSLYAEEEEDDEDQGSPCSGTSGVSACTVQSSSRFEEGGVEVFNERPTEGLMQLWESGVVGRDEASVATFLRTQPNLCKESIGSYISQDKAFNREVFENYLGTFDFHDMHLDEAVLSFFLSFKSTGCAQAGDRMMQKVTAAFITANPYSYDSAEAVYMLSFAVLMLHTDAHSEIIESKMSKTDFIQMNHGVNDGEDFPEEMLGAMYDRVVAKGF